MKSLINTALLKEQLRRFWVIGVVPMLAYLLGIVLPLHNAAGSATASAQTSQMITILSMSHPVLVVLMVLAPFCAAMALYPYHFKGTAANTFYTFPINKRQLFWTNFAAGTILILLPLLILSLVLLAPITFHSGSSAIPGSAVRLPAALFPRWLPTGAVVNTFGRVAGFFARAAVGFMFYFAVFLVAVSVAGNRVIAVLISVVMPFVPFIVFGLVGLTGRLYVFGISDTSAVTNITDVVAYINPVFWSVIINNGGTITRTGRVGGAGPANLLAYFAIYIGVAALLLAAAYVCSNIRKQEKTEDSIVFKPLKNLLVFLLSMAGMFLGAALMVLIIPAGFGWYFGGALGFVLLYFTAQMIAEKSLNIFAAKAKGLLYFGGVMVALYGLTLFITTIGMGFYVNRVPAPAEVERMSFHTHWESQMGYISNPEIIARTTQAHQDILNNRRYLRRVLWEDIGGVRPHRQFNVTYVLHDGTRIQRAYRLSRHFDENYGIASLLNEPDVLFSRHRLLQEGRAFFIVRATIRNVEWDQDMVATAVGAGTASFIEAVKAEHLLNTARVPTQNSPAWYRANIDATAAVVSDRASSASMTIWFYERGPLADWLRERRYMD